MKLALVLSGGGAKGSYELGVYKALRRLHIKPDIITGTSIGSLNGALLVTGDYRKAKKLWLTMSSKEVFGHDFENKKSYLKFMAEVVKNKGVKFDKAEEIMSKYVNEKKIRRSKTDFGLITYNLKSRLPKSLTKKDIPEGKMLSYIMASASCFPLVEVKKVDGEEYIDGGFYDNLPINLAIEMGADKIIAVDLSAIGIKQKVKNKDIKIDYITTTLIKDFILDFNPKAAKKNMMLGYNDTMKHFKKLDGKNYTFKKGQLNKNYKKAEKNYISLLKETLMENKKNKVTDILKNRIYKNIFDNVNQDKSIESEINSSMEYLAELYGIDKEFIYKADDFNKILLKSAREYSYITVDKNLKGKMLISYIYNKYMDSQDKQEINNKLYNIALLFQKDFLAVLYLIAISKK